MFYCFLRYGFSSEIGQHLDYLDYYVELHIITKICSITTLLRIKLILASGLIYKDSFYLTIFFKWLLLNIKYEKGLKVMVDKQLTIWSLSDALTLEANTIYELYFKSPYTKMQIRNFEVVLLLYINETNMGYESLRHWRGYSYKNYSNNLKWRKPCFIARN